MQQEVETGMNGGESQGYNRSMSPLDILKQFQDNIMADPEQVARKRLEQKKRRQQQQQKARQQAAKTQYISQEETNQIKQEIKTYTQLKEQQAKRIEVRNREENQRAKKILDSQFKFDDSILAQTWKIKRYFLKNLGFTKYFDGKQFHQEKWENIMEIEENKFQIIIQNMDLSQRLERQMEQHNESKIKPNQRFPYFNLLQWISLNNTSLLLMGGFISLTIEGIIQPFLLQDIQKSLIQQQVIEGMEQYDDQSQLNSPKYQSRLSSPNSSKRTVVRTAKVANAQKMWGSVLKLPLHYAIAFLVVLKRRAEQLTAERNTKDLKFGYILNQRSIQILESINLPQIIESYPDSKKMWFGGLINNRKTLKLFQQQLLDSIDDQSQPLHLRNIIPVSPHCLGSYVPKKSNQDQQIQAVPTNETQVDNIKDFQIPDDDDSPKKIDKSQEINDAIVQEESTQKQNSYDNDNEAGKNEEELNSSSCTGQIIHRESSNDKSKDSSVLKASNLLQLKNGYTSINSKEYSSSQTLMTPTLQFNTFKSLKKVKSQQNIRKTQQSQQEQEQFVSRNEKRKTIALTKGQNNSIKPSAQNSSVKPQQSAKQPQQPQQPHQPQQPQQKSSPPIPPAKQQETETPIVTEKEQAISRKQQLKLRLAKVIKPLYLSRSKIMMDAYPSSRSINKYTLTQTHKENVLINPPVDYIVDNKNYSEKKQASPKYKTVSEFSSPKREQINIQKVQFFEQDNGFSLNTRVDIIDTVKQSMQNWNFSETQKYNQRVERKQDENLRIERALSRKYLKTPDIKRGKTRSEDDNYNTFIKGEKINIQQQQQQQQQYYKSGSRAGVFTPTGIDRRTNLGVNLDFYMKSEPTIQKVPYLKSPLNNQGISLCGSYGSQQFVKKIAERLGSPPSINQFSSGQRPQTAQITRKNANLLSPKFKENKLTKYSHLKSQMKNREKVMEKKNSYLLNMIDKNYQSQKSHGVKQRKQSQPDRVETPDKDQQELLIIDQNQSPMKRAFHRPFNFRVPAKSQFQDVDHHPGGKGGLTGITFFGLNKNDESSTKINQYISGNIDLNEQRKKIFRKTISSFSNSFQKIRLKSIQGLKANIHEKITNKGTKKKQPPTQSTQNFPQNFQLTATPFPIKIPTRTTSIRCCTPEQIFKDHIDAVEASNAITHYVQNRPKFRSSSEKPIIAEMLQIRQNEIQQIRKQIMSHKNQFNPRYSNKINPNQIMQNKKSRSLKDIDPAKWKSSQNHWMVQNNKSKSSKALNQKYKEKVILQNKQIETYYKKILEERKTAKKLLIGDQDVDDEGDDTAYNTAEDFKIQTFRTQGDKAKVFRQRKNSDFQKHLKQSLGLKNGNKKREKQLVDGKTFLFKKQGLSRRGSLF